MKNKFPLLTSLAMLALLAMGCNSTVSEPDPFAPASADTARNIFANKTGTPAVTASDIFANKPILTVDTIRNLRADTSSATIRPYTYFDLDGKTSLTATSDTAAWDLAIRTTGIRVNGQFQLLSSTNFDSVLSAPADGYTATGTPVWYDYNMTTNTITPKAGSVLVIKTAGGKYAKIQLLSYYKNNPASPNGTVDTARYYTFRYFLQTDGSKNLNPALPPYTYFSLRTNAEVTDTSAGWDLALRTTGFKVNGQSQLLTASFDSLNTAPDAGYTAGSTSLSWYDYNSTTNIITPKAGMIFLLKTSDGKYAKLQISSYYKHNPAVPTILDTSRYYSFRYFLQADGSKNLKLDPTPYTYFSLHTNAVVTDTSAGWDIALRTTTVKVNGQSQILSGTDFDTLSKAPDAGYGSGSTSLGWYDYSGDPYHTITPKLATVFVVKTVDNKYAKIQFLSYYKNSPANPNGVAMDSISRYTTFRYFLQDDGTKVLK